MMWRDVVELLTEVTEANQYNEQVVVSTEYREVFANKKSVRQSEFYQALATGLKPEVVYEIRYEEYRQELKLRADGTVFHIIRTFSKNDEKLELVCSRYLEKL